MTNYFLAAIVIAYVSSVVTRGQEFIDVGDHKLAVARYGKGAPTVVFESGAGSDIKAWSAILPRIGEFTTALAYARAGRSDSEPAKTPRALTTVVDELRTLLQRGEYKPPYVLVGRSLGGIYVRAFALMYPAEVAGIVLVDPSHERQGLEGAKLMRMTPEQYAQGFEQALKGEKDEVTRREMEGLVSVFSKGALGITGKMPDLPTVIITNTRPEPKDEGAVIQKMWRGLHDELFQNTSHGMHILTDKSGHDVAGHEPDLVIDAIRWVVSTARDGKRPNK